MSKITVKILDGNGNLVFYRHNSGKEEQYKYDENSNLIYEKDVNGIEFWHKYDKNNNLIYSKNSDGRESYYRYEEEIKYKQIEISKEEFEEKKKNTTQEQNVRDLN